MKKGPKRDAAVRQFVKLAEGRVRNPQQVTKLVDALLDAMEERLDPEPVDLDFDQHLLLSNMVECEGIEVNEVDWSTVEELIEMELAEWISSARGPNRAFKRAQATDLGIQAIEAGGH